MGTLRTFVFEHANSIELAEEIDEQTVRFRPRAKVESDPRALISDLTDFAGEGEDLPIGATSAKSASDLRDAIRAKATADLQKIRAACIREMEIAADLEQLPAYAEFAGRLLVTFSRTRASYLRGESCAPRMSVHAVTAEAVKLDEFPGFKTVDISFEDLDYLVRSGTTSWRTALGSVAGVYLISDTLTGKLYVGSATGEGGIWSRWCQYVDGQLRSLQSPDRRLEISTDKVNYQI